MKKTVSIMIIAALAVVTFAPIHPVLAGDNTMGTYTQGGFNRYYQDNPTTVEQLIDTWGNPAQVIKSEDGTEKYVFKVRAIENDVIRFIVKDGKVVGCL